MVLTLRGVSSSELFKLPPDTKLAGQMLRRAAGFDQNREAVYSEGAVLLETVHRVKGQAADAVVLVDEESDSPPENYRNRLFVGMTRGRLVVSFVSDYFGRNVGAK